MFNKNEFTPIESAKVPLGVNRDSFNLSSPGTKVTKVPKVSTEAFYRNAGLTFSKPLGSFTLYFYSDDHTIPEFRRKKPAEKAKLKSKPELTKLGKVWPRRFVEMLAEGMLGSWGFAKLSATLVVNNDSPYPYESIKSKAEKAAIMDKACVSESFTDATLRTTTRKDIRKGELEIMRKEQEIRDLYFKKHIKLSQQ